MTTTTQTFNPDDTQEQILAKVAAGLALAAERKAIDIAEAARRAKAVAEFRSALEARETKLRTAAAAIMVFIRAEADRHDDVDAKDIVNELAEEFHLFD